MQKAFCPKHLKFVFFLMTAFCATNCRSQNTPLFNAFAHNDYWHTRPLYDALDNGFLNVEADIYLRDNELLVAHILPAFQKRRTLEQLYLKPLLDCYNGTNKEVIYPAYPLTLMIDIKSDADKTYTRLAEILSKYSSMLSSYDDGKITIRKVTVVLTGNKPYELLKSQPHRLAFIDEDLMQVQTDTLADGVYQTASCKYSRLLNWNGTGSIPDNQRRQLCKYVAIAHQYGKKVRLWASPENKSVWKELLSCGVDLINTDRLAELRDFLLSEQVRYAKVNNYEKQQTR